MIGVLLAGCASSSGGLSRSQLDAQADSICQQGTAAVKAAGPLPADFEMSSVSAARYLDEIVPIKSMAGRRHGRRHALIDTNWSMR